MPKTSESKRVALATGRVASGTGDHPSDIDTFVSVYARVVATMRLLRELRANLDATPVGRNLARALHKAKRFVAPGSGPPYDVRIAAHVVSKPEYSASCNEVAALLDAAHVPREMAAGVTALLANQARSLGEPRLDVRAADGAQFGNWRVTLRRLGLSQFESTVRAIIKGEAADSVQRAAAGNADDDDDDDDDGRGSSETPQ